MGEKETGSKLGLINIGLLAGALLGAVAWYYFGQTQGLVSGRTQAMTEQIKELDQLQEERALNIAYERRGVYAEMPVV